MNAYVSIFCDAVYVVAFGFIVAAIVTFRRAKKLNNAVAKLQHAQRYGTARDTQRAADELTMLLKTK